MKRIPSVKTDKPASVILHAHEADEAVSYLRTFCSSVSVITNTYELDDNEKIADIPDAKFDLSIKCIDPVININIGKGEYKIEYDDTTQISQIEKVKKIIEQGVTGKLIILELILTIIWCAALFYLYYVDSSGWAILTTFGGYLLYWIYKKISKAIPLVNYVRRGQRTEHDSFIQRNKDSIIVGMICTVVGGVIVGFIMLNFSQPMNSDSKPDTQTETKTE